MEAYGVMVPLILAQLVTLGLLGAWAALAVVALVQLRGATLSPGLLLGWSLLAVLVPWLGGLAVMIIRPGADRPR